MRTLAVLAFPLLMAAQDRAAEMEAVLGTALAVEHGRRATVVDSDAAKEYLSALPGRLLAALPAGAPPFRIALVANEPDGPVRYPAALPGGYIFVPVRLIVEARDEAAFARQLAHAMAHISEGHLTTRRASGSAADMATIPLVFVNYVLALDGPPGAKMLVPRSVLARQERWEAEAEAVAERMMSGFAPDSRFGELQTELRALAPPRKAPTLRRAGEAARQ